MLESCQVKCAVTDPSLGLNVGDSVFVRQHPLDKTVWYMPHKDKEWELVPRWAFDHAIMGYAVCEAHYGLLQLPVLEESKATYTVITPGGYVSLVDKASCVVSDYSYPQRISCSDIRYR